MRGQPTLPIIHGEADEVVALEFDPRSGLACEASFEPRAASGTGTAFDLRIPELIDGTVPPPRGTSRGWRTSNRSGRRVIRRENKAFEAHTHVGTGVARAFGEPT
jgi:hypothetical protein